MKALFVALALVGLSLSAIAQSAAGLSPGQPSPARLSAEDWQWVAAAERALNQMDRLRADFVQSSPGGWVGGGTFYLHRPGRLRFEYVEPINDFVVADGTFLWHWDSELEQQSHTPIGASLADFILRRDIRLAGDITVASVAHEPGTLRITAYQTDEPLAGTITLVFDDAPVALRQWRVVDAHGAETEVTLINRRRDVAFEPGLFTFTQPGGGDYD